MSSRSRYQQARNRRLPPRHNQEVFRKENESIWNIIDFQSRSTSSRRMGEEEIDRTFDQLYEELVSFGDSTKVII